MVSLEKRQLVDQKIRSIEAKNSLLEVATNGLEQRSNARNGICEVIHCADQDTKIKANSSGWEIQVPQLE